MYNCEHVTRKLRGLAARRAWTVNRWILRSHARHRPEDLMHDPPTRISGAPRLSVPSSVRLWHPRAGMRRRAKGSPEEKPPDDTRQEWVARGGHRLV